MARDLAARLDSLEQAERVPARPRLTDADRLRLANRFLTIYATEGRDALIARLAPPLGAARALTIAGAIDALAARHGVCNES